MDRVVQLSLTASGSPSDVKARLADQADVSANNADNVAIIGALRGVVEKQLASISEDATVGVTVDVRVVVGDPPAIVTSKQDAQRAEVMALKIARDAATGQVAALQTELAQAKEQIAQLTEPKTGVGETSISGS